MLQMAQNKRKNKIHQQQSFAAEFPNIVERIRRSKLGKRKSLTSFIKDIFNFRGGISDDEIDGVIGQLQKQSVITIDDVGRVTYQ